MENSDRRDYFVVAPIFKCLSSSTKCIIVADRGSPLRTSDIHIVLDMIHYVAEQKAGLRLPALYLDGFRCSFQLGLNFDSEIEHDDCVQHGPKPAPRKFNVHVDKYNIIRLIDFIAACRSLPCDRIRLQNCIAHIDRVSGWPDTEQSPFIVISCFSMAGLETANNLEVAVWDALEASLPLPTLEQRQALTRWLATLGNAVGEDLLAPAACKVLCATQTADPRPTQHYRGTKWCIEGLGNLQLEKLSHVALNALIRLADIVAGQAE
ncbi:uncharacterized protein LOC129595761 [Paramacrobiotus metropolitanus]|uniref:uncharacterized protein LOC129595761 n=1 Tax=Paramacrobiotus metropolitanus TaxID=2943436 RepID=UPI0024456CB2|nr:uncharacterized protein LOC129595761 [Paramacrobiotus metropolitanus]